MDSIQTINPDPKTTREAAFVNYKSSPGFKLIFEKRLSLIPETTNWVFFYGPKYMSVISFNTKCQNS
jgi:hypothetical protein